MRYLVVTAEGSPEAIDAYMYGDNGRAITVGGVGTNDRQSFSTVVVIGASGAFGLEAQRDRLASGLYFSVEEGSFEAAVRTMVNQALSRGLAVPAALRTAAR